MMKTLLASAAAVALSAGMADADYNLTILHTNDFHARFEQVSKYDKTTNFSMGCIHVASPSFEIIRLITTRKTQKTNQTDNP